MERSTLGLATAWHLPLAWNGQFPPAMAGPCAIATRATMASKGHNARASSDVSAIVLPSKPAEPWTTDMPDRRRWRLRVSHTDPASRPRWASPARTGHLAAGAPGRVPADRVAPFGPEERRTVGLRSLRGNGREAAPRRCSGARRRAGRASLPAKRFCGADRHAGPAATPARRGVRAGFWPVPDR